MRKQWQRAKFQKGTPVGLYSERPLISLLLATPQPLSASWKSASLCKLLSPIIFPSTHGYGSFWLVLLIAFSILILSFPWSQWHACLSNMHSKFQIVFLFFTFFFFSSLYSPLELIFTDLWGPFHLTTYSGFKYYVSFIDAFSRYTWIFPIKTKVETTSVFQDFKSLVELQLNTKIKSVQSDWGVSIDLFLLS